MGLDHVGPSFISAEGEMLGDRAGQCEGALFRVLVDVLVGEIGLRM